MEQELLKKTQEQVIDLIQHGFYQEAEAICVQAEKVFDNRSLKQLRTVAVIGLKDWTTAEILIQKLVKENPSAGDYNNLSIVKKNQNLLSEAKKYAEIAIKLNFTNPLYFANLSSICWLLGEKSEAFKLLFFPFKVNAISSSGFFITILEFKKSYIGVSVVLPFLVINEKFFKCISSFPVT